MKFQKNDLDRLGSSRIKIDEKIEIKLNNHPRCHELKNILVVGEAYNDSENGQVSFNLNIQGEMIVPCAISFKPLTLEFETDFIENFSFYEIEAQDSELDYILIEGDTLDLEPHLKATILAEVPLKYVDPDLKEYPKGDGWVVMTEEDYEEEKSKEIDPRLAKLKDIKLD